MPNFGNEFYYYNYANNNLRVHSSLFLKVYWFFIYHTINTKFPLEFPLFKSTHRIYVHTSSYHSSLLLMYDTVYQPNRTPAHSTSASDDAKCLASPYYKTCISPMKRDYIKVVSYVLSNLIGNPIRMTFSIYEHIVVGCRHAYFACSKTAPASYRHTQTHTHTSNTHVNMR